MSWILLVLGLALIVAAGVRVVAFFRRPADQRREADRLGVGLAMLGVLLVAGSSQFE